MREARQARTLNASDHTQTAPGSSAPLPLAPLLAVSYVPCIGVILALLPGRGLRCSAIAGQEQLWVVRADVQVHHGPAAQKRLLLVASVGSG